MHTSIVEDPKWEDGGAVETNLSVVRVTVELDDSARDAELPVPYTLTFTNHYRQAVDDEDDHRNSIDDDSVELTTETMKSDPAIGDLIRLEGELNGNDDTDVIGVVLPGGHSYRVHAPTSVHPNQLRWLEVSIHNPDAPGGNTTFTFTENEHGSYGADIDVSSPGFTEGSYIKIQSQYPDTEMPYNMGITYTATFEEEEPAVDPDKEEEPK